MSADVTCNEPPDHEHTHGPDCGHTAIKHGDHTDYLHDGYLHDGHLHHPHGDHVDEHTLEVSAGNPADCTPDHVRAPGCGHEAVPHGDHFDYLVDGQLASSS